MLAWGGVEGLSTAMNEKSDDRQIYSKPELKRLGTLDEIARQGIHAAPEIAGIIHSRS